MDKRKITQASPTPDGEDRARKRRKQSTAALQQNGAGTAAAAAAAAGPPPTQALGQGQGLLDAIMNHQERNRLVRQHFEKLPSQADYPDYYQKITSPISLHEIQTKLNSNQYASLQDVQSDLLLMCQNAATYNKPKSQVHSDSIRVRNVIESYMAEQTSRHIKREDSAQPPPPGRQASSRTAKVSPAALQQEMAKIVDDMMALVDDQGELVAHYFLNLPSKKLYGDYFRIIKTPISLNMIKKKVAQGEFTKWTDFEHSVALVKKNAEEFNDEGSDIVKDARRLDEYFTKRLAEGKARVGEAPNGTASSGIKLRINVGAHRAQSPQKQPDTPAPGPKIRLNVGRQQSAANNPPPAATSPPAPAPQPTTRPSRVVSKSPIPPPAAAAKPHTNGNSASPSKHINKVVHVMTPQKPAASPAAAPTPAAPVAPILQVPTVTVAATAPYTPDKVERSKSPPNDSITVRANSTPHPHTPAPNAMPPPPQRLSATPGPSNSPAPLNVPAPTPPHHRQPTYYEEPRYRPEGKDASSALISNFRITSSPSLPQKFQKDLLPDTSKLTTQFFLHLPSECHTIVVTPTLSALNLAHRPYKLAVEQKVSGNSPRSIAVWTQGQKRKEEPPFEVRLTPGVVNTIECTVVTAALKGGGWELERFRVFVSLLPGN